jgi:Ca2+-binding RTX toxin-like protein
MSLSAAEQYLLELMNRARLNPVAEAALMGIGLNDGLAQGAISRGAKQVLAPNALLEAAATGHSLFMLQSDVFSHTGKDGTVPSARITAQGYDWVMNGENIALISSSDQITLAGSIEALNRDLFLSAEHRVNLMKTSFQEVGLGAELGLFTEDGTTLNAAMLTEDFGTLDAGSILTGVAYRDLDANHFYSMGEGQEGIRFSVAGHTATTASAGGYAALGAGAVMTVTGSVGKTSFAVKLDMRAGNVKLDLVDGDTFQSSGSLTLWRGVEDVVLLGVAGLTATGDAEANHITGNAGGNNLRGLGGADVLNGADGRDVLSGGAGTDRMSGGDGADRFIFVRGSGVDTITDFDTSGGDLLRLGQNLWGGGLIAAEVVAEFGRLGTREAVLDFGAAELHLKGLTTLDDLAGAMVIF